MASHNDTGRKGEDLAAAYLAAKGLQLLHRNWRHARAEVDIVALDGRTLVLVEVKTRSSARFGQPQEFVSSKKQRFLAEAASCYMEQFGYNWQVRFDIISVLMPKNGECQVTHFEDAFFPEWGGGV